MNVTRHLVEWLAGRFHVPASAMRMFRAANAISGIDRSTLPAELIPLNAIQLSRGLLNFTVLQGISGWVLPYWVVQQYDPGAVSFVPRSHLGLSMNITQRNWTALGHPSCPVEPVVDPRGLVTPFRDGWSIDTWVSVNGNSFFPSTSNACTQELVEDLPVVRTTFPVPDAALRLVSRVHDGVLHHTAVLTNATPLPIDAAVGFVIRPFNPEGVSLLHDIAFADDGGSALINDRHRILFDGTPNNVHCSGRRGGDVSLMPGTTTPARSVHCPDGLATGIASFSAPLAPGGSMTRTASVPLEPARTIVAVPPVETTLVEWKKLLGQGTLVNTPEAPLNSILQASLSTLLMLCDGDTITPGPAPYHQFWFRDAAYMLYALDLFGFSGMTAPVIRKFPDHQDRDGYFRSQQGEWDSNGQALWTLWQHVKMTGNADIAPSMMPSLLRGIDWIARTRVTGDGVCAGLMPAGLSAEHLGLADFYFWDNFWSLAGLQAMVEMADAIGQETLRSSAAGLLTVYTNDVLRAIARTRETLGVDVVPAAAGRTVDCGMVGSICGLYPLQVFPYTDAGMLASLDHIRRSFFHEGMFFQSFIHSGMNAYLTLQVGHAYLYAGRTEEFHSILRTTLDRASPTYAFPEAIHPGTGGGSMGDGHHGWAAAEVVSAVHDMFLYERPAVEGGRELVLLSGIPVAWFENGTPFGIENAPVTGGRLTLRAVPDGKDMCITIYQERSGPFSFLPRVLVLPPVPVTIQGATLSPLDHGGTYHLPPSHGSTTFVLHSGAPCTMTG